MFRRRRTKAPKHAVHIDVHVNARLQPRHRWERFEDTLSEALARLAPGSRIEGAGTALSDEAEQLSCDIEVLWAGAPEGATAAIVEVLEGCGVPRGSRVSVNGANPVGIGTFEGI